ncbi:glycosyltransferase [Lactobacillus amylovorus]|uniref:glycosyltransferase n=1 Tax=Lactobacillus amylovorus TaxID=1604 RepID=UPI00232EBC70|nr:glycosyltransferase [Lactobacillus amylovorus]MDB6226973.1 glycosyltransferase [Lactobacillus amylovorus]
MKGKAVILLSTFNGEKYLSQLLNSLEKQENVDFDIFIRDDGSSDRTREIIIEYSKLFSNIRYIFENNIGYAKSFWRLLQLSSGYDYYAFCDQDDIWKKNKLYKAILMFKTENIPLLYTSRVIAINNDGKIISHNAFGTSGILNAFQAFQRSIIPGCVMVMNKRLHYYLCKYNGFMESHDWATYCIASVFGKVMYDDNSYIYYRITENNTIGIPTKFQTLKLQISRLFKKSLHTRSRFAHDFFLIFNKKIKRSVLKDSIRSLGFYREKKSEKIKLLFNFNFKGLIFKIYVLLNRV